MPGSSSGNIDWIEPGPGIIHKKPGRVAGFFVRASYTRGVLARSIMMIPSRMNGTLSHCPTVMLKFAS